MITSKQNAYIKTVKSLKDKKYRDEYGLFLIEGVKMVKEAILSGVQIQKILATEKGGEQLFVALGNKVEVELVSEIVFDCLTDEVSPQGVLAVAVKPNLPLSAPNGASLFLDGVSDPGNVGAIIRTAAASGYKDIYLANSADAYSPKSVRASMSGIYKVNVYSGDKDQLLKVINQPIVIADMNGCSVFDCKPMQNFCLVIGNEAHGVSKELRDLAQVTVSIPMQNDMESLNASVSAGILMYALKNSK